MKTFYLYFLLICMLMAFDESSAMTYIPRAVDLGLSVMWCDRNMFDENWQTKYFYWGETNEGGNGMTETGFTYPTNICGTEYDVVTENYGGGWRMPTAEEYKELCEKCSATYSNNGLTFTAPNGSSITFQATGYYTSAGVKQEEPTYYWTGTQRTNVLFNGSVVIKSQDPNIPDKHYTRYPVDAFKFTSAGVDANVCEYIASNAYRCSIRPVLDINVGVEPYVVLNDGTLTFYYDDQRNSRTGTKYRMVVPSDPNDYPVWAKDSLSVKKVEFHPSFSAYNPTSTARWFCNHKNLTTIVGMENLNTSKVTSMYCMFYRCGALKAVDVSHFDTSNVTHMGWMFYYCNSLTSLKLSNFNTENVTNMKSMFCGSSSLTSLDVSNFNTANVTTMAFMFNRLSKLETLELRNFNTAKVKDMNGMFYNCSALKTLNIGTFNTDKVTAMNNMFYGCSALEAVDVSAFSTASATTLAGMFWGCNQLRTLYLGGFSNASVSDMSNMFRNCSALTSIYVQNTWSTSAVTSSSYMFTGCTSLVGGNGTKFNSNYTDKTYARIDATGTPGYLTSLSATISTGKQAYAVLNNGTLTFYYDNKASSRTGMKYQVPTNSSMVNRPLWTRDYNRTTIQTVTFDAGFKSFTPTSTAYWFYHLPYVTRFNNMGNLNTSKVTSMAEMFRYCYILPSLDVSTFDTSNVTDMSCMFCYCFQLASINVSNFNTAKVTNMSHMFHCCPVTTLDVSHFNTENVTDMSLMFSGCKKLNTLDLQNFNTAKVANMAYMFLADPVLTTINASDKWSTKSVSASDYMFYGCYNLVGSMGTKYSPEHIDHEYAHIDGGPCEPGYLSGEVKDLKLEAYAVLKDDVLTFYYDYAKNCREGTIFEIAKKSNVIHNDSYDPVWAGFTAGITKAVFDESFSGYYPTFTSHWFGSCHKLLTIEGIQYLNTDKVEDMVGMFLDCYQLASLDLSTLNTANATNMSMMFWGCLALENLDVSGFNTSKVTDMSFMFSSCQRLKSLDVRNFNTKNVAYFNGMFKGCPFESIDVSGFDTRSAVYMNNMFTGCRNLKYIDVSKFNTAKVEIMYDMFSGCQNLSNLDVSGFDTKSVIDMCGMFSDCSSLTKLDVSNFNTNSVENMGALFWRCSSLSNIDVSNFDTKNVKNMGSMFSGCSKLETVDVSKFDTHNVEHMGDMFANCSSLAKIDVSHFNTSHVAEMAGMFSGCKMITSLDMSNFKTANVKSMYRLFSGCPLLKTIYAGIGWNTESVSKTIIKYDSSQYGDELFSGCTSLVGGAGTKYDANRTDYTYAHIDGGTANPGYFTYKAAAEPGDVNGDGSVDVADIASIISVMAGSASGSLAANADVNGDSTVDVADIATVISIMAAQARMLQPIED